MILRPHALEWFWAAHILEQTKLWAKHHAGIVDSIRFSFTCSLCIPIHGCSSNTASLFVEEVLSWGVLKTEFRTLGWLSHGFCFLLETSMARNGNGPRPSDISGEWMNIICKLFDAIQQVFVSGVWTIATSDSVKLPPSSTRDMPIATGQRNCLFFRGV